MLLTPSKIYSLSHPVSGVIVYVGKCVTALSRRLCNHEYRARSGRDTSKKGQWVRDLQGHGERPVISLLEETQERWQGAERRWIAKLRAEGHPLFNVHPGGNGAHTRARLDPKYVALLGVISDARVAEQAGLSRETITYHRRKSGIPASGDKSRVKGTFQKGLAPHNKVSLPPEILALLGTQSDGQLAKMFGVSKGLVKQRRAKEGIPACRPKGLVPRGTEHFKSKFTEAQVKEIRDLSKGNLNVEALARKFGVHASTVYRIMRKKGWKHI